MISQSTDLYSIQRELEVITEALESLQEIANAAEVPASMIGDVMTPLCLNLGNVIDKLQRHNSNDDKPTMASDFVKVRAGRPRINLVTTNRAKIRSLLKHL